MSRATVTRRLHLSFLPQRAAGEQLRAAAVATTAARSSITTVTTPPPVVPAVAAAAAPPPPPAAGAPSNNEEEKEDEYEDVAIDEAAAKRALLLKRYGDRTPPSGPIAVKMASPDNAKAGGGGEAGGFDVEKAAKKEVNHNEIWGDYVRYMEHQRKKGWKT